MRELIANFFDDAGRMGLFGLRGFRDAFRKPFEIPEIIVQLGSLGVRSTPLIALSGLAVGVVMSMHTRSSLERFGAEALIPNVLAIAMIKETGPLVTALLLAGRVGAGIGAELGGMRVTEQIDALESLAVDSFKYLVSTRVVACMIAQPLLTTVFNFMAISGGFLAETMLSGISFELYFQRAFSSVPFRDYIPATLKTAVFGFLIAAISSYLGYNARGGAEGVGRASTQSVVASSIILIIVDVILVRIIFFAFPEGS
ncbi:MAG: ABC transporter permease [Acidobacteria bacterium]|nr:ABC transporter permease [Acidobacteriota bacterium]